MDAAYLQNVSRLRAVAQALKEFARLLKLEQEEDHWEISIDELRDPFLISFCGRHRWIHLARLVFKMG